MSPAKSLLEKEANKVAVEIEVGNVVKLRNMIDNFKVGDIGIVINIIEPTINFPQGVAIVKMDAGLLECYWTELEVIDASR
jgi:hypothetical protein